ncbi:RICIN domain-containing protein [Streptomyces sp. NPDC003038]|uniref:RICIN domain-containing protein n=1 Tax=unclassified Streptomyces TaxID=2593676 RepID=UPI0033A33A61
MSDDTERGRVVRPGDATSAAEFVEALRGLKQLSGLSLRQIEERGAEWGLQLSRSTVAAVLARETLPRPDVVDAFLKVCLDGPPEAQGVHEAHEEWMAAYRALAAAAPESPAHVVADREAGRRRLGRWSSGRRTTGRWSFTWWRRNARLAVPGAVLALAGVLLLVQQVVPPRTDAGSRLSDVWNGSPTRAASPPAGAADASGAMSGAAEQVPRGDVRIRTARTGLCLSERAEGDGTVFLDDCAVASPPVAVAPAAKGTFSVTTKHPVHGMGCMGIVSASKDEGARAGNDYCTPHDWIEFRIERAAGGGPNRFRIMPTHTGMCLTVAAEEARLRTPVQQSACRPGAEEQIFLIDPSP